MPHPNVQVDVADHGKVKTMALKRAEINAHTSHPKNLVRKYYFTIPILPKVKILLYHSYPAGSQKMMTE